MGCDASCSMACSLSGAILAGASACSKTTGPLERHDRELGAVGHVERVCQPGQAEAVDGHPDDNEGRVEDPEDDRHVVLIPSFA